MALPVMSPAPTNTYMETAAPNVREDLASVIYQIDPMETPVVSLATRDGADQVTHEWLVQELYPAINVPQPEGFTAAMSPAKPPLRLNNVCQILARTVGVSDTTRVVVQVGEEEYSRQMVLRGMEVRRDLEITITGETIKTIADPRRLSGLQTWCSMGVTGAGGAPPLGDGSNAHTPGTPRDLTLSIVEDAMQNAWNAGGKIRTGVMSASVKRWFSNMAASGGTANPIVAQNMWTSTAPRPVTIAGSVAVFQTDFGDLDLVPDRFCPAHILLLIDPDHLELSPLPRRDFIEEDYAKTGDNTQGGVVWEGTLTPTAPKAHSCVWDLNQ